MTSCRALVIGLGGLGSAALHRLAAELGPGVLGLEQFELGHHRGASQDQSRILRLAQHEHPYALALGHEPAHPIDAFSITRPALTDPDFPRSFHV